MHYGLKSTSCTTLLTSYRSVCVIRSKRFSGADVLRANRYAVFACNNNSLVNSSFASYVNHTVNWTKNDVDCQNNKLPLFVANAIWLHCHMSMFCSRNCSEISERIPDVRPPTSLHHIDDTQSSTHSWPRQRSVHLKSELYGRQGVFLIPMTLVELGWECARWVSGIGHFRHLKTVECGRNSGT